MIEDLAKIENVEQVLQNKNKSELLEICRNCLRHVIASNYTGFTKLHESSWISEEDARKCLARDLITPCVAVKSSWALVLTKRIMENINDADFETHLLKLRFFIVWQQFLTDKSNYILEQGTQSIQFIQKNLESETDCNRKCSILLKMTSFYFMFYQYDLANECIENASKLCKLNVDMTGMLGKRTRYQTRDVAQLVLVYENPENVGEIQEPSVDVPTSCVLNDDTLLEQVAVTSNDSNTQVDGRRLSLPQLCCLLWIARHEKSTHHGDALLHERCTPFLNAVIASRRCWPLQSAALLLRADLEKSNGRTVDRSCSQTELICKLMQGIDDESSDEVRIARTDHVLSCGLEPAWMANVLHTGILKSLGCTSEALLILEKLELWDNVIDCYKTLGQLEKAEALIRRLRDENPDDTMLLVYLGDITQNPDYFIEAIEKSGDRNARAHRSLEVWSYSRFNWALGSILDTCAWKLENYKDAATCYHRCVSLQPDHFEAWSNLSAAYIRYGMKEKAWKLLQEALKFNYEHPNVWENYMLLSVDVGSFGQAILAYHRLLDLNKRGADDEVLELIALHVLKREKELTDDNEKLENSKEKSEMIKLLARITANHQTLSSKTLKLYAELKRPSELNNETRTEYEKYIQILEKSLAVANGKQNWSKDEQLSVEVAETAILLANERLSLARHISSATSVKEASARVRLSLNGVITRIEKDAQNRIVGENEQKLAELIDEAKGILTQLSSLASTN
ncbi:unnamed protein product [Caenorhabditis bovis]|uniref:Tetratricopeptide repeat protein 27 n=1 Tax=Caenorhabditis bovis TaxID=2654633 RepID=A0A8S1ERU8_9PELO|nr:unnamed protein product [Caenorhabditis bovis]